MSRAHAVHRPLVVGVIALAAVALVLNWTVIGQPSAPVGPGPAAMDEADAPTPVVAWSACLLGEPLGAAAPEGHRGGVVRLVAAADRLRFLHADSLVLLDAGSASAGASPAHRLAARTLHEAMSMAGYDACNVGRGEQLLGARALAEAAEAFGLSFVSLNVRRLDGSPAHRRHVVLDTPAGRTLVTGVAHELRVEGAARTLRIDDPVAAVRGFAAELASIEHDHAVLLADVDADTLRGLAAAARGFDLVLGGAEPLAAPMGRPAPDRPAALAVRGQAALGVVRVVGGHADFAPLALDDRLTPAERAEPLAAEYLRRLGRLPTLSAEPERVRSRAGGSTYGFDPPDEDPSPDDDRPRP